MTLLRLFLLNWSLRRQERADMRTLEGDTLIKELRVRFDGLVAR